MSRWYVRHRSTTVPRLVESEGSSIAARLLILLPKIKAARGSVCLAGLHANRDARLCERECKTPWIKLPFALLHPSLKCEVITWRLFNHLKLRLLERLTVRAHGLIDGRVLC